MTPLSPHHHHHHYYYYFLTLGRYVPEGVLKLRYTKLGIQIYQSVQSGVGKLSCNKTALKRRTSTETLWNRKAPSLSSPEDEEIFLPKSPKSWHADVFKGPIIIIIIMQRLTRHVSVISMRDESQAQLYTIINKQYHFMTSYRFLTASAYGRGSVVRIRGLMRTQYFTIHTTLAPISAIVLFSIVKLLFVLILFFRNF